MACIALATLLLAGCAGTPEPPAPPFAPLVVPPALQARFEPATEAEAAARDWQAQEQAAMQLAVRSIGSAAGQPTGLARRPVKLHRRIFEHRAERHGGIVLAPGFTESATIYAELVAELVRHGWSVYVQDHRGQGFSSRLVDADADPTLGHLDRFDRLVQDFDSFVADVAARRAGNPRPLLALAHSMGGAVVSLSLARAGAASALAGAVLVTPMHDPAVEAPPPAGQPPPLAQELCQRWTFRLPVQLPWLSATRAAGPGFEAERAAWQAAVAAGRAAEGDELTHSAARLARRWEARVARCEGPDCGHGDARVAGPTVRWVNQACAAAREARGPGAAAVARPVLLLQGGSDTIVTAQAQQQFCAQVNRSTSGGRCTGVRVEGARHGLLTEADRWRRPAMQRALAFLECVAAGRGGCG